MRFELETGVYNEERNFFFPESELFSEVAETEKCLKKVFPGTAIIHPARVALLLGDKKATVEAYSRAGIPVPETRVSPGTPVFSIENAGTQRLAQVVCGEEEAGSGPEMHNARFINTVQEYNGVLYYVILRACCFGGELISVLVRARPVSEGSPSVHTKNTPLDSDLIEHLYWLLVSPSLDKIVEICRNAKTILGPGFFVHDILPCADSGKLYVCESGIKLGEHSYRSRVRPIESELKNILVSAEEEIEVYAKAFIAEMTEAKVLAPPERNRIRIMVRKIMSPYALRKMVY